MKQIKIENKEYNFPEKWSEIVLKDYVEITKIVDIYKDIDITDNKNLINRNLLLASIILRVKVDTLKDLDLDSAIILCNLVTELLNSDTKDDFFIVEIDCIKYGLCLVNKYKLTTAEALDLQYYRENITGNYHKLLSVLYRPINRFNKVDDFEVERYDSDNTIDNNKRADLFLDKFPASVVINTLVFFWTLQTKFIENTSAMGMKKLKKIMRKEKMKVKIMKMVKFMKNHFKKDGSGI